MTIPILRGADIGAADTGLYRSAANTLKTDDLFIASQLLSSTGSLMRPDNAGAAINLGNGSNVNYGNLVLSNVEGTGADVTLARVSESSMASNLTTPSANASKGMTLTPPAGQGAVLRLASDTRNRIKFASNDVTTPVGSVDIRGSRLHLYDRYAIGIESGHMWYAADSGHKFYRYPGFDNVTYVPSFTIGNTEIRSHLAHRVQINDANGYVVMNEGSTGAAGYVAFHKPGGARNGYIGWGDGADNNISWTVGEQGGTALVRQVHNSHRDALSVEITNGANDHTAVRTFLPDTGGFHHYGTAAGNVNYHVNGNGDIRATSYANISDGTLKKNVRALDAGDRDPLAMLRQLRPVEFQWKKGAGMVRKGTEGVRHFGFIAQEVEKVAPDLVEQNEVPPGYDVKLPDTLALRTGELVAPLVAAVQQLADRLDALEAKAT